MPRIHSTMPILKTLFRIGTHKPGSPFWHPQDRNAHVESETAMIPLFLYDSGMVSEFMANMPKYIVSVIEPDSQPIGYIGVEEQEGKIRTPHPAFEGCVIFVELHPMFDRSACLDDLYALLLEIADKWQKTLDLQVDFEERYCWASSQLHNLLAPQLRVQAAAKPK